MRVGLGFDVHRLVRGRKLILGGIIIPYSKGLLGVSCADVVLHSISDAILGALAKGDIGDYYPPQNSKNKGISSLVILKKVLSLLKNKKIINLDVTIIAQKPRLKSYKGRIKNSLAKIFKLSKDRINIKIKSQENLIPTKKECIICLSLVNIK